MRLPALSLAFLLLATDAELNAQNIAEKDVLVGTVTRSDSVGYIFLRGQGRQAGIFLRVPEDKDRETYELEMQNALVGARTDYQAKLARWEARSPSRRTTKSRPVEPTRESVSLGPIELQVMRLFRPKEFYQKNDATQEYSYFMEAEPGNYIWYGPVELDKGWNGSGTCFCMGTVRFEVKAGTISNLGNSLSVMPAWADDISLPADDVLVLAARQRRTAGAEAAPVQYDLPASLNSWPSAPAELHAWGKTDNFYGVLVRRLPQIPGVLAYQRDVAIDVQTGKTVE